LHTIRNLIAASIVASGLSCASPALAEPTQVVVRAISKDAKFIGDSMGGVEVTLTDARSGKVLARGKVAGATGDTKKIVVEPRVRRQPISTPEAARFEAMIDIDKPTLVKAQARGPLGKPAAAITVSSTMWVLPGKPVAGDGWLLEFPGLVVEPVWSRPAPGELKIDAKVTLMCGCPIEPGGHWDAARYEVRATLSRGSTVIAQVPLAFAGQPSSFTATLPAPGAGAYQLLVTAQDAGSGNTGVSESAVSLKP
jgi:hypothetical protein